MSTNFADVYALIREQGGTAYFEQERGLIAVWGSEAVQFLDGLITNDMKTLEDGQQMHAAFPNAQGRLLAVVRVARHGDKFLFETEAVTRQKLYQYLFRFTFAGDFYVEDLSDKFRYFELFGGLSTSVKGDYIFKGPGNIGVFVDSANTEHYRSDIRSEYPAIPAELYRVLCIENGMPAFGSDMDENTIVPELGFDGLISYTKGCYIGQEVIARIHFRGHVAKRLTGLLLSRPVSTDLDPTGTELSTNDGKNAGKITSTSYSPKLSKDVALGFVRHAYLDTGTILHAGDAEAVVTSLPFFPL